MRDGDSTRDDRAMSDDDSTRDDRTMSDDDDERPMHEPTSDYEQGRADEAREQQGRFERAPEAAEDPTRSGPQR